MEATQPRPVTDVQAGMVPVVDVERAHAELPAPDSEDTGSKRSFAAVGAEPGEEISASRARTHELFVGLASLPSHDPNRARLRDQLVEMHLPFVRFLARRFAGRGEPMDDLLQVGALGLVKAVDRFEPERGVKFTSYAGPTITGEFRRYFRDRTGAVRVHRALGELTAHVRFASAELVQQLGRAPTTAELAAQVQQPEDRVWEALVCAAAYRADSLDRLVTETRTVGDTLGMIDPGLAEVDLHESLVVALSGLTPREQRILQLRFYGNMTQAQIAGQIGVSQMQVSRLIARALLRLRGQLAA